MSLWRGVDMEVFVNNMKEMVTLDMILYGLVGVAIILIALIIWKSFRIKGVKAQLSDLEMKYNELKSIPLSFKLNKATALSKVNQDIHELVVEYQEKFNVVQEKLKEFSVLLAEIDDFVYAKKVKKAKERIEMLLPLVEESNTIVGELNELLDGVLEQENMQRTNINVLKNRFREDKRTFLENRGSYRQSVEFLDDYIIQIENMFSIFEEWMFASEFNKASEKQAEIKTCLDIFENYLNKLPSYYEIVCVVLPNQIDKVNHLVASAENEGVYLKHLDIKAMNDVIRQAIDDLLLKLNKGDIERVELVLEDCTQRLTLLEEQVTKEASSFRTISDKINLLFERIKNLNLEVKKINEIYNRVHERFGFETLGNNIKVMGDYLDALNELRFRLENFISQQNVPYSTLLVTFEEVEQETERLEATADEIHTKLDNATSDEERAKKQLVKLQMIVNEMRIKFTKYRLPSVDEKFEEDIRNANVYIVDIKQLLDEVPLNVEQLNSKLKEAIDFIYTLYNSVNNLVGMAKMVENAILFGNKYRSEYPEVDSELTRAELCFANGQYTKALKISISTIEKIHPGVYEKLLAAGNEGEGKDA